MTVGGQFFCFLLYLQHGYYVPWRSIQTNAVTIAHACGGIDGQPYTNSREALLASLENGFKFIEGDLGFTADSVLVLMYSEEEFRQMSDMPDSMELTRDVFCRQKIYGRYTPQTAADVLSLAKQHDFVLVTNKVSDPDLIERHFSSIRERTMVEAFSISDYKRLKRLGYTPMLSVGRHYSYRGLFTILSDKRHRLDRNHRKGLCRYPLLQSHQAFAACEGRRIHARASVLFKIRGWRDRPDVC